MGEVRAVLWQHAAKESPPGDGFPEPPAMGDLYDPNRLIDADEFSAALAGLTDPQLDALARSYIALWARTFRTLVRHLRGHPERALALFCDEVYPFLRGQRRATHVRGDGPHGAEVLMEGGLPAPYLAGLLAGFVALSRAQVEVEHAGDELFRIHYKAAAGDRLARLVATAASFRMPLMATAAAGCIMALAWAGGTGSISAVDALIVFLGVVAAQGGANALHLYRGTATRHPWRAPAPGQRTALATSIAAYAVATGSLAWFLVAGRSAILVFAMLGVALSLVYPFLRDQGLGPIAAGLAQGPLVFTGSAYAVLGALPAPHLIAIVGAPIGFATAAILFLDDMADLPLDDARGRRTLAVRIPATRHAMGYGALLLAAWAGAVGCLIVASATSGWVPLALTGLLGLDAGFLVTAVQRGRDVPQALAAPRVGTMAWIGATAAVLSWVFLEVP